MRTFTLCNLGCSKNMIDGEHMIAYLERTGYTYVQKYEEAEIILVNTCTFIQDATQQAIDAILEAAEYKTERGRCRFLGVTGCFSQRYRQSVNERLPEVDCWFGVESWPQEFARVFDTNTTEYNGGRHLEDSATQYLRIARGCSNRCSFCIIPSLRGAFRSRPVEEVLAEAKMLQQRGTRECILVAQDTARYGRDTGSNLALLLQRLLQETDMPWIRLMYCNPRWIDDRLIETIAENPRICPYFDMPLQHISPKIRRAMRRSLDVASIYRLIERIRTRIPDAALRTSLITGFPGETKREFSALKKFVKEVEFDKLGVFPYSAEEGTEAYSLRPRPHRSTAQKRAEEIMVCQQHISARKRAQLRGRTTEVIIDEYEHIDTPDCSAEESDWPNQSATAIGRTRWDAPEVDGVVYMRDVTVQPGSIVDATVTDSDIYDLYAVIGAK